MEIKEVKNLSNEVYHSSEEYHDYWSSSNLKEYLKSPREAYYQKYQAEKKQTDALAFGNILHDYLASKHINGQPFEYNIFEPPINPSKGKAYGRDTLAYKKALADVENPITPDTMQLIGDIWSEMRRFQDFWWISKNALRKGYAEQSFFVEGLHKYKYRPDVLTDKYIIDWKTITKNIWSEQGIKRRVTDLGYDISAAMYQHFEFMRTGVWKPFIIIWIMKDPPFDFLIDDISQFCFEKTSSNEVIVNNGAVTLKKIKEQHEACEMAQKWPGLSAKYEINRGIRMADYVPSGYQDHDFEFFDIDIERF